MAHVSTFAPGSFCWVELATTDQKAAVAFYRSLFDWDVTEIPLGPGDTYSMFKVRGEDAAAAFTMRPEEQQAGGQPHWNLYIAVASVEDVTARAESLGAKATTRAYDVMDAGRMAILQDPTGAEFRLWQANRTIGFHIMNEPGAFCWSELSTRNLSGAERFYTQLFGWTGKHSAPGAAMEYIELSNQGNPGIGMMPMPAEVPAGVPSYWMPYFQVADCGGSAKRAAELGATTIVPPNDIKVGHFALFMDPQGALFAIFAPAQ